MGHFTNKAIANQETEIQPLSLGRAIEHGPNTVFGLRNVVGLVHTTLWNGAS